MIVILDFELDPEIIKMISEELQYITSVLIASYTVKQPQPVHVEFNSERSYVSILYRGSGELNEELWKELIETKDREIRDRINKWFNRDRELQENNWYLLDSMQRFNRGKSSRRNSVEYLGQRFGPACSIPQQEQEKMDDSLTTEPEKAD